MSSTLTKKCITHLLFGIICITASFSLVHVVPEWEIVGKWIGFLSSLSFSLILLFSIRLFCPEHQLLKYFKSFPLYLTSANIAVAIYCILQIIGVCNNNSLYTAVADFDNPTGVASLLCVTFPFAFRIVENRSRNIITVVFFIIDSIILYIIKSRTGLITLSLSFAVGLILEINKTKAKGYLLTLSIVLLLITSASIPYLFFNKTASTKGRMVIVDTCLQMITDRPLFGHGIHGFGREYMHYQAEYFKTIEDNNILMLSDNVSHPLLEYLLISVNYGLFGLLIVLALIVLAIKRAFKKKGHFRTFLLMEVCTICIFSLFSYPFRYPMTTLALLCCIAPWLFKIIKDLPQFYWKVLSIFAIITGIVFLVIIGNWYMALTKCKEITDKLNTDTTSAIEIKHDIFPLTDKPMSLSPRYLYSRAVVNYYAEDYVQALLDAHNSSNMLSSYNTELLIGNIHQKMSNYDDAEIHYWEAAYMCPSKIMPLYRLFKLYEEQGDTVNMVNIGHKLLDKPVKVHSRDTRAMRLDVRRKLLYL